MRGNKRQVMVSFGFDTCKFVIATMFVVSGTYNIVATLSLSVLSPDPSCLVCFNEKFGIESPNI